MWTEDKHEDEKIIHILWKWVNRVKGLYSETVQKETLSTRED